MGRIRKDINEKVESKLFELLLKNSYWLKRNPLKSQSVGKLCTTLTEWCKCNGIDHGITRRGLNMKLQKYLQDKMIKVTKHPKDKRKRIYYCSSLSALFKKYFQPFLSKLKITSGSISLGMLPLDTETHFFGIRCNSILIEDGLDVSSEINWEDAPQDLLGDIRKYIDEVIAKEILKRIKMEEYERLNTKKSIEKFRNYLKNKKLALVYIIDGSDFKVIERDKMRDLTVFEKMFNST